ncbi:LuxR C-terminal-related transcriptional regulator [Curvibacter sp. APW13]|uniref:response regulator transcription factor n=1 Tax=Curvibacter sp. APW13 TaxID=3077236 RepID=UPI0028DE59AC|nr:LuxR C-terminal-related transcriptional regulator [Curvibacter sp. APW13]MDT8990294.1 LuxR C-terminal-related transcriptional regulator [Curvibacter sp. APW13]
MSSPERVDIHVVDDDADVRDGLAWLFDSRGYPARTWGGGEPFVAFAKERQGDWGLAVVLLDVRMEPLSGPMTFEQLKGLGCPWPVLFLTGHGDVGTAVGLVKNGAHDFLEKPFQDNVLVDRIEQAMQQVRSQTASEREAQRLRQALAALSPREREVLDELVQGHYNKNIADHLGITPRTVEFHRANIFEKMGVDSAIELAHKLGQLKPLSGQD